MNKKILTGLVTVAIILIAVCAIVWARSVETTENIENTQVEDQIVENDDLATAFADPASCIDHPYGSGEIPGTTFITSLSVGSGSMGDSIEVHGCNFAGFEGDKNIWIENSLGERGLLYGDVGSTGNQVNVTLDSPLCGEDNSYSGEPCGTQLLLTPGVYELFAEPWGNQSNKVQFTIL